MSKKQTSEWDRKRFDDGVDHGIGRMVDEGRSQEEIQEYVEHKKEYAEEMDRSKSSE
jgi:hypothetical protein